MGVLFFIKHYVFRALDATSFPRPPVMLAPNGEHFVKKMKTAPDKAGAVLVSGRDGRIGPI
jgi:hypothetical protein